LIAHILATRYAVIATDETQQRHPIPASRPSLAESRQPRARPRVRHPAAGKRRALQSRPRPRRPRGHATSATPI
jgi:hypothetical protein